MVLSYCRALVNRPFDACLAVFCTNGVGELYILRRMEWSDFGKAFGQQSNGPISLREITYICLPAALIVVAQKNRYVLPREHTAKRMGSGCW
jgi:hypothetical protein